MASISRKYRAKEREDKPVHPNYYVRRRELRESRNEFRVRRFIDDVPLLPSKRILDLEEEIIPEAMKNRSISSRWHYRIFTPNSYCKEAYVHSVTRDSSCDVKVERLLQKSHIDIELLTQYIQKKGSPPKYRHKIWPLLLRVFPSSVDQWPTAESKRRQDYNRKLQLYFKPFEEMEQTEKALYHQIKVDVPRTATTGHRDLFSHEVVQETLLRVLYVWSREHPDVDYFQGLNDICAPIFVVLLSGLFDQQLSTVDMSRIARKQLLSLIEADVYWCLKAFMAKIRRHFIGNAGIAAMITKLESVVQIIQPKLYHALNDMNLSFYHFSVRWMICFFIRDLHIDNIMRLWDYYISHNAMYPNGFLDLHVYNCAAFLLRWQPKLMVGDFSSNIILLQHLDDETIYWTAGDIEDMIRHSQEIAAVDQLYFDTCLAVCLIMMVFVAVILIFSISLSTSICTQQVNTLPRSKTP